MKRVIVNIIFLILFGNLVQAQTRPEFESWLSQINADSLKRTVMDMQSFKNRFCASGNKDVAQYVVNRLQSYGVSNAAIDSFYLEADPWFASAIAQYMYNAKGTLTGSGQPDSTVIIGAHLDAVSFYTGTYHLIDTATAGADDNASGIAVMLEIARIIHQNNLTPRLNLSFVGFDAEEIGLYGGYHDTKVRWDGGEKIAMMINNDMVGTQPENEDWILTLHWYDNATEIASKAAELCEEFTAVTPYIPDSENNGTRQNSDSWAYAQWGFKAIFAMEYNFSPYYHSLLDSYEFINFDYMAEVAKMNFALMFNYTFTDVMSLDMEDYLLLPEAAKLYPNPATFYVDLTLSPAVHYNREVAVYDVYGKLCKKLLIDDNTTRIEVSDLVNGIYFLQLSTGDGNRINKKFVKMSGQNH